MFSIEKQASKFTKNPPNDDYWTLLILEVLYLWNALPVCNRDDIRKMQAGRKASSGSCGAIGRASLVLILRDVTRFTPLLARLVQ